MLSDPDRRAAEAYDIACYAAEGRIGGVAARAHSIMGYITQTDVLLEQTGPAIADALDAVLRTATEDHPAGSVVDLGFRWTRDDLRERQLRKER